VFRFAVKALCKEESCAGNSRVLTFSDAIRAAIIFPAAFDIPSPTLDTTFFKSFIDFDAIERGICNGSNELLCTCSCDGMYGGLGAVYANLFSSFKNLTRSFSLSFWELLNQGSQKSDYRISGVVRLLNIDLNNDFAVLTEVFCPGFPKERFATAETCLNRNYFAFVYWFQKAGEGFANRFVAEQTVFLRVQCSTSYFL